jgi:arylsulfatase A-like enzyme
MNYLERLNQQRVWMKNFIIPLFCGLSLGYSQNISVSGKIVDPDGKGIGGCSVNMGATKTTSTPSGDFSISFDPTSSLSKPLVKEDITLSGNFLEYSLTQRLPVQISLKNINGRSLYSTDKTMMNKGPHRLNLSEYVGKGTSSSVHFLSLSIGDELNTFKVISANGQLQELKNTKPEANTLSKLTASSSDLKLHCPSSLPKYIPVGKVSANVGNVTIKKANILLLVADDMNSWTSMTNNWAKTPNLDNLAKSGVFFERAHVIAQECNPSRAAFLMGKRPSSTGIYWNRHDFRNAAHSSDKTVQNRITLPQYFKNRGYETFGYGKIFHQPNGAQSDPISWTANGVGAGTPVPSIYSTKPWHNFDFGDPGKDGDYNDGAFLFGPMEPADPSMTEESTADYKNSVLAVEQIKKNNSKPWFIAYGVFRPHAPLVAPKKYFDMYPLNEIELPKTIPNDLNDVPPIGKTVALNWGGRIQDIVLKYNAWKGAVQAYKACASFADAQLGRVIDAIDKSPEKDNTVVIFLTDHGVHLGEKEHWWKMTLWLQTTHIPFIVRFPGLTTAGARNGTPIDMASLYPTILDALNLSTEGLGLDGKSIVPLLENPDAQWDTPAVTTAGYKNHSVVTKEFRYIQYEDGGEELYDLKTDSLEFYNLVWTPEGKAKNASTVEKLKAFLPKVNLPDALKQ